MSRGASMDAISLDDWELLPNHMSSFFMEEYTGHGTAGGKDDQLLFGAKLVMINMDHFAPASSHPSPCDCILDEEARKQLLPPLQGAFAHHSAPAIELKDIDVEQEQTESKRVDLMPKVTEILIPGAQEGEEMIRCSDGVKEACEDEAMVEAEPDLSAEEEEDTKTGTRGLECIGFGVGKLKVNGVGALCSFGVAAATFFIFLFGGRQQSKHHNHKIQLQMYADDERIQQAVQQASRLNQAMSSVIGDPSTRASISFGGYYNGF